VSRLTRMAALLVFVSAPLTAAPLFGPPERLNVFLSGGRSIQNWHGQADVEAVNIEFNRDWSKRTEVGFVVSPTFIRQPRSWFGNAFGDPDETARALSGSLLIRHRFMIESKRMQPYIELSTGPMWATRRVPAATSHFNFISQGGFGVVFAPDRPMSFVIGYRMAHISNGGYAPRNPGLNIHTIVFGTRIRP
jgi:hypothetical protein